MTRNLLLASLTVWSFLCVSSQSLLAEEPESELSRGVVIPGRSVRAILAAVPELEKRGLSVEDYVVNFWQLHEHITVYFANPEDVAPNRKHTDCWVREGALE